MIGVWLTAVVAAFVVGELTAILILRWDRPIPPFKPRAWRTRMAVSQDVQDFCASLEADADDERRDDRSQPDADHGWPWQARLASRMAP